MTEHFDVVKIINRVFKADEAAIGMKGGRPVRLASQLHDLDHCVRMLFLGAIRIVLSPEMADDGITRMIGIAFSHAAIGFHNIQLIAFGILVKMGYSPEGRPGADGRLCGEPAFQITRRLGPDAFAVHIH